MKKTVAFILVVLILAALSGAAFAESGLTVQNETLIEIEEDDSAYFFAKIENTGDQAVGIGTGKLVGFSEDDDILITEEYLSTLPSDLLLEPGEYAYLSEYVWESELEDADIAEYRFSVKEDPNADRFESIPCEARYEDEGKYDHYIYVTFKNETEEVLFDTYITVAMYDTDGNLIYVDGSLEDDIGVHPDSTVTIRLYVDSELTDYYSSQGIEIGEVDAIVYYTGE